jgi:hypothetical protein
VLPLFQLFAFLSKILFSEREMFKFFLVYSFNQYPIIHSFFEHDFSLNETAFMENFST